MVLHILIALALRQVMVRAKVLTYDTLPAQRYADLDFHDYFTHERNSEY